MKYIIILLILLILISGCSKQIIPSQPKTPETFSVKYYASYSSGGGTRTLDITYAVKNGEIISCDGNYVTAMTDGTNTYACEIEKLKTKQYNVPLELITEYSQDKKTGEVHDGPSWYKWEILE